MERSVLLHHIKTSCYALSAIVLTGWVTDALNEGLIFKMILRFFRPDDVERYSHPFTDLASFFIWFIPLLFTTLLLLLASVMTLHHVKKPHLYRITKKKPLLHGPHVIGTPAVGQIASFLQTYTSAEKLSLLLPQVLQLEYQTELASIEGARDVEIHLLKENDDLQKIALELEQWVKKRLKNRPADNVSRLFMDITYATPVRSAAALFCSLDQDIELIQGTPDGKLSSYDLVCKVQE
ncbi:hypothetical protein RDT67_18490 [Serratia fonticola]|uniref:Uncharacterized protein n=1 Tax=Serratia fonticola TaxID=47917 RepID=A0AAJ2DAH9_SERFO|nr:hypothetical protein [Serratia fonticola]MDQ9128408.1 hypothetical protein [Serratia fonticola]CAI2118173.1 Uncharacterised protein [Serratia fonticola]